MQHPSRIMGKSYNQLLQVELRRKHDLVARFLGEHGLDGVWLAYRPNFAWYTGGADNAAASVLATGNGKPHCMSLVVTLDCTYVLADSRMSHTYLLEAYATLGWQLHRYDGREPGAEGKLLIRLTENLRIGADTPHVSFKLVDRELACLSQVLMAGEQARYRILCQECASVVETVARTVIREQTEQQLVDQIADYCERASIVPLRVTIERDRFPRACYRTIWGGNHSSTQVLLKLVAARGGLQTTVTRMVMLGGASRQAQDTYHAMIDLLTAYFHLARPGQTMSDVYDQCMTYRDISLALHPYGLQLDTNVTGYRQAGETSDNPPSHIFNVNQTIDCTVSAGMFGIGGTFIVLPDWNEWLTVTNNWPMTTVVLADHTYYIPDMLYL